MSTSREHLIDFMGGPRSEVLMRQAQALLYRKGASWLTDEQLAEIVTETIRSDRRMQRNNARNRALAKAATTELTEA